MRTGIKTLSFLVLSTYFQSCIEDAFKKDCDTINNYYPENTIEIEDPTIKQIQGAKDFIARNRIYEQYPAIQGQWKILESYDLNNNPSAEDILEAKKALDNIVTLLQQYKQTLEATNQTIPQWLYEFLLFMNARYTVYSGGNGNAMTA